MAALSESIEKNGSGVVGNAQSSVKQTQAFVVASLLVGGGEVNGMAQGARLISLAAFDPITKGSGVSQTRTA